MKGVIRCLDEENRWLRDLVQEYDQLKSHMKSKALLRDIQGKEESERQKKIYDNDDDNNNRFSIKINRIIKMTNLLKILHFFIYVYFGKFLREN